MKRVIIIFAAVILSTAASAQQSIADDTVARWDDQHRTTLVLGFSAGVNLYTTGNQFSPYYSKYGLLMQVPLLLQYDITPRWRLSTGARLDFTFNPLHYNVDWHEVDDGNGYIYADGLEFQETFTGKQHYFTYFFHFTTPYHIFLIVIRHATTGFFLSSILYTSYRHLIPFVSRNLPSIPHFVLSFAKFSFSK